MKAQSETGQVCMTCIIRTRAGGGGAVERQKEECKGRQKEEDPWGQLSESLLVQGCSANGIGRG